MRPSRLVFWIFALTFSRVFSSCSPTTATEPALTNMPPRSQPTETKTSAPAPTFTALPVPTATRASFGPNQTDFPKDINPLTGQLALDPSLLKIPAMLVSISHFPPTARPQAGLSFAPWVFEFSITGGESRFLSVFYGQWPAPEIPITGTCAVRKDAFKQTGIILGRRVWLDANKNGMQDPGEPGIGGICVNLYDANGNLIEQTTTDTNGYYGFNVSAGTYTIEFVKPPYLDFTKQNAGDKNLDSDADPVSGKTQAVSVSKDDLSRDAGMVPNDSFNTPTPDPQHEPAAQIGPIRSGRLLYGYISSFFTDSCLIYAFASPEVLAKIPKCFFVSHEIDNGGYMLDIQKFKTIALENQQKTNSNFDYASNYFSQEPPAGGVPAQQINVFYSFLNQSGWIYDPLYQAYLRYVDNADKNAPGVLHADVDRLTGRQIHVENVIVLMADTDVVEPTNLDIHLDMGNQNYAFLFRDGQMFKIKWNTLAGDYEKQTGFQRPIKFVNMDGSPAALKPGHTWIIIVTPFSLIQEQSSGTYLVRYAAAEGEAR
jgi:hypothetical protein